MNQYSIDRIFTAIEQYFVKRTEPQIKQKRDRHGNFYWQIYEPISGCFNSFGSELEIKMWLDRHYEGR